MNAAEQYVATRLAEGWQHEVIVSQLVAAGWDPAQASGLVGQHAPRAHPVGGAGVAAPMPARVERRWVLVIAVCAAALSLVVMSVFVATTAFGHEGPRQLAAALEQSFYAAANVVQFSATLWVIALVALIVHRAAPRPPSAEPPARPAAYRRSTGTLHGWCLALLITGPILSIGSLMVMGLLAVALGVMCGEAVSASCGL